MKHVRPFAILVSALVLTACSGSKDSGGAGGTQTASKEGGGKAEFKGETRRESAAGISFLVPAEWASAAPSGMRAAQFEIPGGKDDPPGELVLFFFGEGGGGGTQANIERWISQFSQPDGKPSDPRTESRTYGAFKVSTVRVNGTYHGSAMMPGMDSEESKDKYRLWGAVVEGQGGPWFFKAVGPQKVIEKADGELDAIVASVQAAAS